MNNEIVYNSFMIFRQYKKTMYFVSKFGDVYSLYSQSVINPIKRTTRGMSYYYIDIYDPAVKRQRHVNVHRMVYEAWKGPIPNGKVIRHLNDNSLDNKLSNLALGDQIDNIHDCIAHNRRVGHVKRICIKDKTNGDVLQFCPCLNIYDHFGLKRRESLERILQKRWFSEKYEVQDISVIDSLDDLKTNQSNVTTMGDECSPVG